jgi:hypothetical protein
MYALRLKGVPKLLKVDALRMMLIHKSQCSIVVSVLYYLRFVQVGGGEIPDETTLVCARGSDRFGTHIPS